jgi:hypothetical protein
MAAIATTRQLPPMFTSLEKARARTRRSTGRMAVATAAAVLLAAVLTIGGIAISQRGEIRQLHHQATALSEVFDAADAHTTLGTVRTGGTVMVTASRSRDAMVFTGSHLSTPPASKAYQLWMIGPAGTTPGPVLEPGRDGAITPTLARGLGTATTIGMTVEPAHGSSHPTSRPILLLSLAR